MPMLFTRLKFLLVVLMLFLFSSLTFAWNSLGHMTIASIAYQNLTPAVREKVDNLVSQLNQEYPDMKTFLNIAYWPDALRAQRIETFTHWHYIDNAISVDGTRLKNLVDTDNAVWAVKAMHTVVKNNNANVYDRARFLSFITHIVGDLHQPLHTVSLLAKNHSDGDRGGNGYLIRMGNEATNLHKLWDTGLGQFNGESSPSHATSLANEIAGAYPKAYFGDKVKELNPDNWAKEGEANAKQSVYDTPENKQPSEEYLTNGKEVAKQEVALAGYRLAELLNQLLAS